MTLKISACKSLRAELREGLSSVKNMHGFKKRFKYDVVFDDFNDKKRYRKLPEYARKFLFNYFKHRDLLALNIYEQDYLVRGYLYWSKFPYFKRFIEEGSRDMKKNFVMIGVTRYAFMLVNARLRKIDIFIKPKTKTHLKIRIIAFITSYLFNLLATSVESFAMHSSGVSIKSKGYLFVGKSGAGKSTIAKLIAKNVRGAKIVSDDSTLIVEDKGKFYAMGMPSDSKKVEKGKLIGNTRIDGIFFVKKSKRAKLTSIEKYIAFKEIVSKHILNNSWFPGNSKDFPPFAWKFINNCSVKRLNFPKNASFIDLLTE